MAVKPVLIVGAGPTGLMLGLWLAHLGTSFRIIDQDEGPGETSRAMAVQARTLEFYRQLGFADEVVGKGLKIERIAVREAGALQGAVGFGDFGAGLSRFPFVLSFPQDAHERVLLSQLAAAGATVERRTVLTGFDQDAGGVTARLRKPTGTETVEASYIAGCDGARSTVRAAGGIGLPGGTYAHRFFVADAAVEGEAAQDSFNLCLTGADFCIVAPLPERGRARLIGTVPDGIAEDDVGFDDVEPSVKRNTGLTIKSVAWFSTYRVHHRVAESFRDRRAFLLGDAAHLHSPVGGQGMNTGLGDAANLGWKLAAVVAGKASPAILDSYEPERIGFARHLVGTTDRLFQLVTDRGLLGEGWRTIVLARALPLAFRLPLVPHNAFRILSQIEIEYRDGPLSQGVAGDVHAGDRLPWLNFGASDNFEPLRNLTWQVHVYGEVGSALRAALEARRLPLHVFAWTDTAAASGMARDAVYLVRPDGHVGFAGAAADWDGLRTYLDRWAIA